MKHPKIAICDDSRADVKILEQCIRRNLSRAEITAYDTGEQLVRDMAEKRRCFRMIFLAIGMEKTNGIETAEEIRRIDPAVPLIFIAVNSQYYREAFDLYAFQYLLKPVSAEKVKEILERLEGVDNEEEYTVHFQYRSHIYKIRHSDIRYISSSLHTVNFHLTNGETLRCRGKMGDFDEQLRGSTLFRCHQSFFVNLDAATGMKGDSFLLGEQTIPVSRSYLRAAQERYRSYLSEKAKEAAGEEGFL